MTPLTAIPFSDIKFFLTLNKISIPVSDIYLAAWDLIKSNTVTSAPPSVTDWIISYNLLSQKINIPIYKTSEILLSPYKDLKDLANLLTLPIVDKESIIRILGYLNVLNNDIDIFEALPQEILGNIIKELDCKSILLICKSSKKFNNFCELKLDELLKQKLYKETKFITDAYNREELIGLCRLYGTKHISVGDFNSLILKDGQVYSFGDGYNGQLGLKDKIRRVNILTLIPGLYDIKYISTGPENSWAINDNKYVYSWGNNKQGQLGLGDMINRFSPILIPGLDNIIQISASAFRSFALNTKGRVYIFGRFGDEGSNPTLIPELINIIQISTGKLHTLALTKNGEIYAFGNNDYGQLGLGHNIIQIMSILVTEAPNNIIQTAIGSNHSLCLTNDGHIYSFGKNENGQLGLGDNNDKNIPTLIPNINDIIQISARGDSSLALSNTGKIYAFGLNNYGQLGLKSSNRINIPTLVQEAPNNIIQISIGIYHSLILRVDGKIYAFGLNNLGQLGLGDNISRNIPTLIPNFNVLS